MAGGRGRRNRRALQAFMLPGAQRSVSIRPSGAATASAPRRCSTRAASPTRRSRSTTIRPSGRRVYDLGRPVDGAARDDRRRAHRRLRRARGPRPLGPPGRAARCVGARLRRTSARLGVNGSSRDAGSIPAAAWHARAERRRAPADDDPDERRPAALARLSPAPVGVEGVLHRAVGAVGERVVAQGRALARDRLAQDAADRPVQPRELVVGRGCLRSGADAAGSARGPRRRRCCRGRRSCAGRGAPTSAAPVALQARSEPGGGERAERLRPEARLQVRLRARPGRTAPRCRSAGHRGRRRPIHCLI